MLTLKQRTEQGRLFCDQLYLTHHSIPISQRGIHLIDAIYAVNRAAILKSRKKLFSTTSKCMQLFTTKTLNKNAIIDICQELITQDIRLKSIIDLTKLELDELLLNQEIIDRLNDPNLMNDNPNHNLFITTVYHFFTHNIILNHVQTPFTKSDSELIILDQETANIILRAEGDKIKLDDFDHMPAQNLMIELDQGVTIDEIHPSPIGLIEYAQIRSQTNVLNICHFVTIDLDDIYLFWFNETFHYIGLNNKSRIYDQRLKTASPIDPHSKYIDTTQIETAAKNVLDYIRHRYIDYEPTIRPKQKCNSKRRPLNLRNKITLPKRRYIMISMSRREKEKAKTASSWTLQHLITILGKYHNLVYCKQCNEKHQQQKQVKTGIHKHSLIGHPCRICKEIVGPIHNILIKRKWVPKHEKGPKNGIKINYGRHLVPKMPK